jgi:hypothetical protein
MAEILVFGTYMGALDPLGSPLILSRLPPYRLYVPITLFHMMHFQTVFLPEFWDPWLFFSCSDLHDFAFLFSPTI